MVLTPEERARIAEEERVRQQANWSVGMGRLKKLGGCFALFLFLLVASCAVLTLGIHH